MSVTFNKAGNKYWGKIFKQKENVSVILQESPLGWNISKPQQNRAEVLQAHLQVEAQVSLYSNMSFHLQANS